MTSIITPTPQQGIEADLKAWEKIEWSPEIVQKIYRDWGSYYSGRRRENLGMYYYDKAIDLSPEDFTTLYRRSQSRRKNALPALALEDGLHAQRILKSMHRNDAPVNLEVCDAFYELNQLETSKAELHNNTRIFIGNKVKAFEKRLVVLDDTIIDACGPAMTDFLLQNEAVCCNVRRMAQEKFEDPRPLWKILKDQGKCDVLSIPEIDEIQLSPLEIARRSRAFDVFNQMFLDRSWVDVIFLKNLRKNPNLLLDQCKNSKSFLKNLSTSKYEDLKTFLKMLEARSPMYYIRYKKFTNPKLMEKFREDYLYRVQYQTRRNMISVLRNIKQLRKTKNIPKLSEYVEQVMGDYVVIKTHRVMPWKFEFLNEVYNTLALALLDQFEVPKNFKFTSKNALLELLHFPTDKSLDVPKFVFGDRTTHQEEDTSDPALSKSRQRIARLEKRLLFAKYAIERSYIMHQIANTHLQSNRYDECCFVARKGIEEAKACNNDVWRLLCVFLILKANAALHKLERTRETLESAFLIANELRNEKLTDYLMVCHSCNDEAFLVKKQSMAGSSRRESTVSEAHSGMSTRQPSLRRS
ncbi:hypothetical protein KR018_011691, partial [Drosophila ironensis]